MQSLFTIQDIIPGEKAIPPLSPDLLAEAQNRLDSLTKPRGSLGRLEEIAMRLHAMRSGGLRSARRTRFHASASEC